MVQESERRRPKSQDYLRPEPPVEDETVVPPVPEAEPVSVLTPTPLEEVIEALPPEMDGSFLEDIRLTGRDRADLMRLRQAVRTRPFEEAE